MENSRLIEVVEEMITGKKASGKKPTIRELEEILNHSDIQLLPNGEIVCIKITDTEKQVLQELLHILRTLDSAEMPKARKLRNKSVKQHDVNAHYDFGYDVGFNDALQECKPYIAKLTLRAEKAEKEAEDNKKTYVAVYKDFVVRGKELAHLKKEKEELGRLYDGLIQNHKNLMKIIDPLKKQRDDAEKALADIRERAGVEKIWKVINDNDGFAYRLDRKEISFLAQAISEMLNKEKE